MAISEIITSQGTYKKDILYSTVKLNNSLKWISSTTNLVDVLSDVFSGKIAQEELFWMSDGDHPETAIIKSIIQDKYGKQFWHIGADPINKPYSSYDVIIEANNNLIIGGVVKALYLLIHKIVNHLESEVAA
ncbi:hypothetical protein [uncultured Lactobacillus sp.]|uniref:hypothetical protein n=1 Tax=uncultured Lactobacillus sp. TaxID=153152 RepID=UPI00260E9905|nr:hypothetical protein [uncultured Lactobacillus sp.]